MAAQKDPKDLLDNINFQALECLNEQPSHAASNVLKQGYREDDGLYLESDTDEQLLIKIPFQQKVKLQGIAFKGPAEEGPKVVKLYANKPSLGFSDVDSTPAAQEFTLTEADLEGKQLPLKLVKFNNVDDLVSVSCGSSCYMLRI
jgi:hypothetical protein